MILSLKQYPLVIALIFAVSIPAEAVKWQIPKGTKANFTIDGMLGTDVDGTLEISASNIVFDPASPQTAVMDATLSVATIKTGIGKRDKHLKTSDYFDAGQYPSIQFHATAVAKGSGNSFVAKGTLTIKSVSRNVSIPFTFIRQGSNGTFNGSFDIHRSDYKVGTGNEIGMGNEVRILLKIPVVQVN